MKNKALYNALVCILLFFLSFYSINCNQNKSVSDFLNTTSVSVYCPDSRAPNFKISIAKTEFKKYEPILVRFDYINIHNKIDTIFGFFNEYADFSIKFVIKSEENKVFNKKLHYQIALSWNSSQFFVEPGDTITLSTPLNYKYGTLSVYNYFGYYGYLEPGNYKFYAQDIMGGTFCKTNELSFKVTDLDGQDINILNMVSNHEYKEVFSSFPLSVFAEHAFAMYLNYVIVSNDIDKTAFNGLYQDFLTRFPNSYYGLNWAFICSYFYKMKDNNYNIDEILSYMKPEIINSPFEKFITNKAIRQKLHSIYNK